MEHRTITSFLIIACAILFFTNTSADNDIDKEVEQQCSRVCPQHQNISYVGFYDLACGLNCRVEECIAGCKLWRLSLKNSCTTVCSESKNVTSSEHPQIFFCQIGCNDAIARYATHLRTHLKMPPAPGLVPDTLNATSLQLEWNYPEAEKLGLNYLLQWKYDESLDWQYCKNQTWNSPNTVSIDNLQPYTKYRFRVALIFHSISPIVSMSSVMISTLPSGPPASPPTSVRAVAVDCTRIRVNWEPGPFPHGPILSYDLRITDNQPNGYSALKEAGPSENFSYTFGNLKPNHNYTVGISMSNSAGTGPVAQVDVSTPMEPTVNNTQKPVLILAAYHQIIEQGTDLYDEPYVLYETKNKSENITGIAIHISQELLYISKSSGIIVKTSLSKHSNVPTTILPLTHMKFKPLDLSIDWLNNQLYILGEVNHTSNKMWQIIRCNLDGQSVTIAVSALKIKPYNIEVDPYNGFLFWAVNNGTNGNLFRLDLMDISNGQKHNVTSEIILSSPTLGAFTVDYSNFWLLAIQNRTVSSVSLDGKESLVLRKKMVRSLFEKVRSLATANKKFYWTDGDSVFYEEYYPQQNSYYHNTYPDLVASYTKILVNLPSSQPVPVPVNPPTSVQAVFGVNIAKITWQEPQPLGSQGKGAWQNWSYEVSILNLKTNSVVTHKNINLTFRTIHNLTENTEYLIKVAAYSTFGSGPLSSEFKGRTLKPPENKKHPVIFWSTAKGLLMSDATGDNVRSVTHMKDQSCKDISWYKDLLYLVTNSSQIFSYNMSSNEYKQLMNAENVDSIAVDWIGKKLYWSNPIQQMIIRSNLNGSQQEQLSIITSAKELNIDAVNAYIYWSTGLAVECAHLNGADKIIYHPAQLFSGNQVMGLTLDMDHNAVYWIVRSSDGSNLYRAPMAGSKHFRTNQEPVKVAKLQKSNMEGPLCYFNFRLLWLQDDKNAVISDLHGRYIASISGKSLSGLNMIYVMDSSLQSWPRVGNQTLKDVSVIPELISNKSIQIVGTWKAFNITWQPVQNVNYGVVFYEIKVDNPLISRNASTKISTTPSIKYWEHLPPYSELSISIRAYTYWDSSQQVHLITNSPASTPSAPRKLRYFVSYHTQQFDEHIVNITIRWKSPAQPNGLLEGYKIKCWYLENDMHTSFCENIKTTELEYTFTNLTKNQEYIFQVQAYTEAGLGEVSERIHVNTVHELPIPKLLRASSDALYLMDTDINTNSLITQGLNNPLQLGYIMKENLIFWITELQELLMFNMTSKQKTKLLDIQGKPISFTVDWVERSIYYVKQKGGIYSFHKLNLNYFESGITSNKEIHATFTVVSQIEISPFTKKLYWTEVINNGQRQIVMADIGSTNKELFIKEDDKDCNCTKYSLINDAFAVDHTFPRRPTLVFIDYTSQNLVAADKFGCHCKVLYRFNETQENFDSIKADLTNIYWTQSDELNSFHKNDTELSKINLPKTVDFLIYGYHIQPYPQFKCLVPKHKSSMPSLKTRTSKSLTVTLPKMKNECNNITTASVKYYVYYAPSTKGNSLQCNEDFKHIETFNNEIEITGLNPFTTYTVCLAMSNHYLNLKRKPHIGPGTELQTTPGAPSKPLNITAIVLNPSLVEVSWLPPEEINGESIRYEILWQTEATITGIRQKGEQPVNENEIRKDESGKYCTYLHRLSSNETYSIRVRAYSQTNETSDSENIKVNVYPEPQNITCLNKTAYTLKIQWIPTLFAENYSIQYSPLTSNNWVDIPDDFMEDVDNSLVIDIQDLNPKTQYKFRVSLKYPYNDEPYIWPKDVRFTFETKGDKPSPPGMPRILPINGVFQVKWEPSKDNGAKIEKYVLESKQLLYYRNKRSTNRTAWSAISPSIDINEFEWVEIYQGKDTSWIVSGLSEDLRYIFRVKSENAYGWSEYSEESHQFDLHSAAQIASKQNNLTSIIIASSIPVTIIALICFCIFCWKCRDKSKKDKQIILHPRGPDVELATLRELPRRGRHNTNILYVSAQPTPDEITSLPHIRRDQITLVKFLGSGAFGEVFEGRARGLLGNSEDIKVAVKTLKKGASEQEKSEFLQEAKLMSHFRHEHILQLLGVCLDNDPHFIIMELMQGGDLLTYLRKSRKAVNESVTVPPLTLIELLKMCVDVAKGCQYLEEMHYVHRDLACRNCLVSSTDITTRIVKIGDFGLARDIYKNDYYRKEGEGLLPVRWMAPESLVDGVFTSQSDVWAFGVLLWEIMTLGQQPYPARNNLEVLHYVRKGGRLGKPVDCPEELYELMLKCWSYDPENRPTFKYCLEILKESHDNYARNPSESSHEGQYISTIMQNFDGVCNEAYFQDKSNNSGSSWKTVSDEDSSRERMPFLQTEPADKPKYLELLYDSDCPTDNDGYEIPRHSFRSTKSENVTSPEVPSSTKDADLNSSFTKVVNDLTNMENLLKDDKT